MAEERMVLTQIREPLVRHAFGEDVPVEEVDVLGSHVVLLGVLLHAPSLVCNGPDN